MTCPTDQRRIEPDGTVLVCDGSTHGVYIQHYNSRTGVVWRDGDRWSWSATCRTCGGTRRDPSCPPDGPMSGEYDPACCRFPKSCSSTCPDCGTGVDPLELVRLAPWVGARLSWKGNDEDVRVTRLAGDYDEDYLLTVLYCELKQFVNVKRSDVDPDVGPWRVIARPAKDTP